MNLKKLGVGLCTLFAATTIFYGKGKASTFKDDLKKVDENLAGLKISQINPDDYERFSKHFKDIINSPDQTNGRAKKITDLVGKLFGFPIRKPVGIIYIGNKNKSKDKRYAVISTSKLNEIWKLLPELEILIYDVNEETSEKIEENSRNAFYVFGTEKNLRELKGRRCVMHIFDLGSNGISPGRGSPDFIYTTKGQLKAKEMSEADFNKVNFYNNMTLETVLYYLEEMYATREEKRKQRAIWDAEE